MCGTLCVCRSFLVFHLNTKCWLRGLVTTSMYIYMYMYGEKKDLLTNSVNPYVKERMQRNKMDTQNQVSKWVPSQKSRKKLLGVPRWDIKAYYYDYMTQLECMWLSHTDFYLIQIWKRVGSIPLGWTDCV